MGVRIVAVWLVLRDIVVFWLAKLHAWWHRKSPIEGWLDVLRDAQTFEDWEEAALHLDTLLGLDLWRKNPTSRHYDWRLINERLGMIVAAREDGDVQQLVNLLRSGLVRNLGNLTSPKLYNRSFAGTKFLIEEYITHVAEAIEDLSALPAAVPAIEAAAEAPKPEKSASECNDTTQQAAGQSSTSQGSDSAPAAPALVRFNSSNSSGDSSNNKDKDKDVSIRPTATWPAWSVQMKLDFVHDTRQAFGRSTLVLQGGAMFGLCHLGVAKALFLQGLLPRIITGTATGALIAALVAIHTEEELPAVLKGDGIDLSAFSGKTSGQSSARGVGKQSWWTRLETLMRRVRRFRKEGHFLDLKVLEQCVRANVGDLTFQEAYNRSKRVLNITVATAGQRGIPTLLNYLTAPNVLIWTAAVASNASSPSLYGRRQTTVLCRDARGNIVPWEPDDTVDMRHWTQVSYQDRGSPLFRVAELFNVNHVIVSQARPYLIPFLQSDMHGPSLLETRSRTVSITAFLVRMVGLEVRHRLRQLDTLQLLPFGIRRFLVDERIPGASMTLVPQVTAGDFVRLLETPTRDTLDYWILRGERSVWPAVAALRIRCAVETELDRAYQTARRLKPQGLRRRASTARAGEALNLHRHRSNSVGVGY